MIRDEWFDALDESGNVTGNTCSRSEAHKKGIWHRTAHVWLLNNRGELLIQRRSLTKDSHPGQWDISCAGHCAAGDNTLNTARRELAEELGLAVVELDLHYLFTVRQCHDLEKGTFIDREHCDVFLLRRDIAVEEVVIDTVELEEIRFIEWRELRDICRGPGFVDHREEYGALFGILESGS
jgi:isopentenyl-diphosphate delta-isomerase type 1